MSVLIKGKIFLDSLVCKFNFIVNLRSEGKRNFLKFAKVTANNRFLYTTIPPFQPFRSGQVLSETVCCDVPVAYARTDL